MDVDVEQAALIAEKNDTYRRTKHSFMVTRGVQTLQDLPSLIQAVRAYGDFTEDSDPYGEHDFGKLEWYGDTVYWKIDYYNQELKYGLDPLDPKCNRVLTVLLSEEY